jgi:hypothetical protein
MNEYEDSSPFRQLALSVISDEVMKFKSKMMGGE